VSAFRLCACLARGTASSWAPASNVSFLCLLLQHESLALFHCIAGKRISIVDSDYLQLGWPSSREPIILALLPQPIFDLPFGLSVLLAKFNWHLTSPIHGCWPSQTSENLSFCPGLPGSLCRLNKTYVCACRCKNNPLRVWCVSRWDYDRERMFLPKDSPLVNGVWWITVGDIGETSRQIILLKTKSL